MRQKIGVKDENKEEKLTDRDRVTEDGGPHEDEDIHGALEEGLHGAKKGDTDI